MKLKKILALVLALALVCTTFAACGDSNSSSTASAGTSSTASGGSEASTPDNTNAGGEAKPFEAKTVDAAKTINVRAGMEPTGLNTLKATYSLEFSMFKHLYDNLYMLDEADVPQPSAAETVDVSEDGKTYTFHLRDDGIWTNGDPVTAGDFEFAWKSALSPEVAADYAYFLFFIKNAEPYYNYAGYAADPDAWAEANPDAEAPAEVTWEDVGVKVIDEKTLEVVLENPTPYAPFLFSFGTLAPVNQKFYESVGADKYNTEAEYFCTNGIYAMTEWSHNSQIVMQKFDAFHGAADVEVEQINWKIITDPQAALTSFLSGELDMTDLSTGELIKQAEAQGKTVLNYSDGGAFYIYFNHNDQYLSNVNLRQALALGFDKQGLIDTVFQNNNAPMTSFTTASVNGFDGKPFKEALEAKEGKMLTPVNGDVEAAKKYLETALQELGCTVEDLSAHLSVDCGDSSMAQSEAAYYQEQWRQNLGIEVTINPMLTKQGSANRQNGNYIMSLTGWGPDYNDPMTFLDLWVTDGGNNQTGFSDAEYDELIAKATTETDMEKRQDYFYRCEEIIVEKLPVAPSWWRMSSYTLSDKIKDGGVLRSTFQDINLTHVKLG